ncbi:NADP-dependent succinate-semialdehyde dehydrogenase [uncultured Desulfuromusa sp.]|uniref:NADP-dependent succinate-semialdehyde dehydrogenase n=1 Tax=uncultured Desulfuromusa sp. TaxID=219183 RepID=UPI002AA6023E|nr:NADP-dependent succinate-semialdehyde dehydrogenase [uncultured Desulfuromusa sp.]
MKILNDPSLFHQQCYIDGQWTDADDKQTLAVTNPANGETIANVSKMGAAETKRAINAAHKALQSWKKKTAQERAKLLYRWFELILENQEDLAILMTLEQGKPLQEARGEISYAASFIEWYAEEAKRIYGDIIPEQERNTKILVLKEPVGVCAAITPWNFPSAMITRKSGPALAAGCTMVLKPASATPCSALALAELSARAGIPRGVLNVVVGSSAAIGQEITSSPIVRKLSFTGSTEIGKELIAACAGTVKKISMELGGNAPFIVFEDADLDAAVEGAIISKYRNTGQTCVCTNRFLVQDSIYDIFAEKLATAVSRMQIGHGLSEGSQQGPLIDRQAVKTVEQHIDDAMQQGARLVTGGKPHALGENFFEPTVLADVTPSMRIAHEETFGPVAPLFRFQSEKEAIAMANDTEFGLAAYFYTRDLARSWRVGQELEYGIIGLNTGLISNASAPFGGIKESGLGREGSRYGIEDYLEIKYLCMGGIH